MVLQDEQQDQPILTGNQERRALSSHVQVCQLQGWSSGQSKCVSILETLLQQRIALKGILKAPQKQETVDLFKCEQEQLMITKYIKIVSQNVWKNNLIVNTILKTQFSFNVIFIQESS